MIWEHYSGLRRPQSRSKVKNLQLGSNVRFVENPLSRSIWPYMFLWEANGLFHRVQAKNSWKKICSSFSDRNKLEFNDGRPWLTNRMGANFFLWKYLILSHFLILKTSTEDSILCHKRDFIHHFFTKGAFACLLQIVDCGFKLGFPYG